MYINWTLTVEICHGFHLLWRFNHTLIQLPEELPWSRIQPDRITDVHSHNFTHAKSVQLFSQKATSYPSRDNAWWHLSFSKNVFASLSVPSCINVTWRSSKVASDWSIRSDEITKRTENFSACGSQPEKTQFRTWNGKRSDCDKHILKCSPHPSTEKIWGHRGVCSS